MAESQKMYLGDTLLNKTYLGTIGSREFLGYGYPNAIVTDSSVALFDSTNPASYNGTGSVWTDLSGNGNDADVTSWSPYWDENGYWLLPGNQGYLSTAVVTHDSSLNIFDGDYTLLIVGSIDYTGTVIAKTDWAGAFVKGTTWVSNPGWGVGFRRDSSLGDFEYAPLWRINNTTNQGTSQPAWTLGNFFVIHLEYSGGVRTIYDTTNSIVAQGTADVLNANNTSNLFLGRASNASTQYYGWAGKYVSAGFYSKVLTSIEREQNINYFKSQLGF